MNIKGKTKLMAYALASLMTISNKMDVSATEANDKEIVNLEDNLEKVSYVKAKEVVEIKDAASPDAKVIGTLDVGDSLLLNCLFDEGFYEVQYNDSIGYVECNKTDLIYKYAFDNMVTFKNDCTLHSDNAEDIEIEKQSVGKLYDSIGSWSLVEVDDNIGYVKTSDYEILDDTFVVVDISDQELNLYHNNEIIYTCPVISGKKSTPSSLGDFKVYQKRYNTDLIGPNYRSHVDVFMKYHNGEGLHDAYRWRNDSEYEIKDYYLNHGSHGCVNMRKDDAYFISDYIDVGTRVLVKK